MRIAAAAGLALALCASSAGAAVLKVPSDDYPTIQSAVNAAMPGDTILVAKGIYEEDVSIDAKANLRIKGKGNPVIHPFSFGIGFAVTGGSEAITITGFEIEGGAVGAQVEASVGVLLSRLFIHDSTQAGIDLSLDVGVTISRCTLDTMPAGIQDVTSDFLVIDRCVIGSVEGTALSLSPDVGEGNGDNHAVVTRNRIVGVGTGIRFGGEDAEIARNLLSGWGDYGIELPAATSSDRTLITRNRLSGGGVGIKVSSSQSTVSKNVLNGCPLYFDGNLHVVTGNRVDAAVWGIYASGNAVTIEGNRVSHLTAFGIRANGTANIVEGNTVSGVTGNGIEIGGGGGTITGNRVSGAAENGVDVVGTGNTVTGNRASGSGGFDLRDHNSPGANTYEDNQFGTSQIQPDVIV